MSAIHQHTAIFLLEELNSAQLLPQRTTFLNEYCEGMLRLQHPGFEALTQAQHRREDGN